MFKSLLLATALVWPFIPALAQDAPKAPEGKVAPIEQVIGKLCLRPLTPELGNTLAKEYSIALVYDSPLTNGFIRNMIFKMKKDVDGKNSIVQISTFIKEGNVLTQCLSNFGGYEVAAVEEMKKHWETDPPVNIPTGDDKKSADAPLTNPPASGTAKAPSFQANPDE